MNVVTPSGLQVLNITGGRTLPSWVPEKKKKKLRKEGADKLSLIQDLSFPIACQCLRASADGEYLCATGVYKPSMRMYELSQLSMKFERFLDCEVVDFQFLTGDYKKLVFMEADRTIELHAQDASYYKFRIPKFGRSITYRPSTAELVMAASGSEVYRFNLDVGRFYQAYETESDEGNNVVRVNNDHELVAVGGDDGVLRCFDPRTRECIARVDVGKDTVARFPNCDAALDDEDNAITALEFDQSGLGLGIGTKSGHVLLYDLRSSQPMIIKDHQYDQPIQRIQFHEDRKHIFTADKKILKIWDKDDAEHTLANIEPEADINDICLFGNSGLFMVACDHADIHSYYIPSFGYAPKWCSFLDGLSEELAEQPQTELYDDYKFVSRDELEQLGMEKMLGTRYLRPYMHGYFVDMRLYKKMKAVANPISFKDYVRERVKARRAKVLESRITLKAKGMKVSEGDDRFSALNSEDFKIDTSSEQYQRTVHARKFKERKHLREASTAEAEEEEGGGGGSDDYEEEEEEEQIKKEVMRSKMLGVESSIKKQSSLKKKKMPLRQRVAQLNRLKEIKERSITTATGVSRTGNKELGFIPASVRERKEKEQLKRKLERERLKNKKRR